MRIAYFIPFYPTPATFVVNEMIEVQEAGHDVVVVPLYSAPHSLVHHKTYERLRPATVLPAALFNLRVASLALLMLLIRPWRVLGTLIPLHWAAGFNPYAHASLMVIAPKALATAWRLREAKVDHIHAHFATHTTTCAGIVGRVLGIPFSFTAHAYDIYCDTLKLRNDTLSWKVRHALQVFAVSRYAKNLLCQRLSGADRNHIHTVYVGIPLTLFREEPPLPRGRELRLLCVASFYPKKGLDTLIDACGLLRRHWDLPFHLQINGDGPLREVLDDQITRLGLTSYVTLGGPIPQEEVASHMKASHIFVMACRKDGEGDMDGIPTVFMEAMATGRPVISCPISGIPELVLDGETGLLVPPDDPSALGAAIMRLACDNDLRIRLGQQARALLKRQHDQRHCADRLLKLLIRASPSLAASRTKKKKFIRETCSDFQDEPFPPD